MSFDTGFLKRLLSFLLGGLGPLLQHIVEGFHNRGTLDKAVELAGLYVAQMAGDTSKSGTEKRDAATAAILADLTAEGMVMATSAVHLLIEAAVNATKAEAGVDLGAAGA